MMKRSEITLVELMPSDWQCYRSLRLSSLQDAPDAFGATYDNERKLPDSRWQERLSNQAVDRESICLMAELNGKPVGLVGSIVFQNRPSVADIFQMWVTPAARGCGAAKAMLAYIEQWALGKGCDSLALSVNTQNDAALKLYESFAFVAQGPLEPLRPGSSIMIQSMVKKISLGRN